MQPEILNDYARVILDLVVKGVRLDATLKDGIASVSLYDPENDELCQVTQIVETAQAVRSLARR